MKHTGPLPFIALAIGANLVGCSPATVSQSGVAGQNTDPGVGTGTPSAIVSGIEYFASPTGSGSTCSSASPCSLSGAQAKVAGMARPSRSR
jgi:hypothetical protein